MIGHPAIKKTSGRSHDRIATQPGGAKLGTKTKIVILGAAGTGLQIAESAIGNRMALAGFLDDDEAKQANGYFGHPVLGALHSWSQLPQDYLFLTSLYGARKNGLFLQIVRSLGIPDSRWATLVDRDSRVSPTAAVACGSYIGPGCVVGPMAAIGRFCGLIGNVYIAHHVCCGDYVAFANSASVCGHVSVGEGTYVGANACIREYVRIGSGAVVGMGAVVIHDVADGATVVGNPARPIAASTARESPTTPSS